MNDSVRGKMLVNASADTVDPANEGIHVKASGRLSAAAAPRDRDLGIAAPNALILLRKVEMFQWQEHCAGADCAYDKAWSGAAIDSHKFRTSAGHENPPRRLADARFDGDIRLGAFAVDPALAIAQVPSVEFPVHAAQLPPNLAASFSEHDGALYAGGDAAHPDIGTVRVSYRIVPAQTSATITGVQRGSKLTTQ